MARVPTQFSGEAQLAGKALESVRAERPLFALPPEPGLPRLFGGDFAQATFLYHDYAAYLADKGAAQPDGASLVFAQRCDTAEHHDLAVVFLPKGRGLIEFVFSSASRALETGARAFIVGQKRGGIRSSRPLVGKYFGKVASSTPGRHCVLIEAKKEVEAEPFEGEKRYAPEVFGRNMQVVTLPGVFSHGELDEGTAFLLERIDPDTLMFDKALDFGSGAGVIGSALKLARPQGVVDFVDSNVMALEATRRTLEANGLSPERVRASDVFSDVRGRYDLIISNPPHHKGLMPDYLVTQRMIEEAPQHLTRDGRIVMVTAALGRYMPALRGLFTETRVLGERDHYRVVAAAGPSR